MSLLSTLSRAALFKLDAEQAHALTIRGLKFGQSSGLAPNCNNAKYSELAVDIAGLSLPNPLGMAAGFDKNGEVPNALISMGFGFAEIGTVTPRPQSGNARPRIFRLVKDGAVINRLGFNNAGHAKVLTNLQATPLKGVVGVNIGANKDSEDFAEDYVLGIQKFWNIACYFTANISSPNTPGLRNLQAGKALNDLLKRISVARNKLAETTDKHIPIFLKIAPDLNENSLDEIAKCLLGSDIDGLVVSNTTITRESLISKSTESGGLSGKPLFQHSTIVLAKMRQRLGRQYPIIGVGGIDNVQSAWEKLQAGADLLQLYTGMIYQGPGLANRICNGLVEKLRTSSFENVRALSSSEYSHWADKQLPPGI